MIKSELVARIAAQNPHLYQRDIENIVNTILGTIVDAMKNGEVQLVFNTTDGKQALADRSVDAVAAGLRAAAKAGSDSIVIINADAAAPHQAVVTVMEAARRASLSQITFATQTSAGAKR